MSARHCYCWSVWMVLFTQEQFCTSMRSAQTSSKGRPSHISGLSTCTTLLRHTLLCAPITLMSLDSQLHLFKSRKLWSLPRLPPVPQPGNTHGRKLGQLQRLRLFAPHLSGVAVLGHRAPRAFQPTLSYMLSLFWLFNAESNSGLCYSILGESGSLYHSFLNLLWLFSFNWQIT